MQEINIEGTICYYNVDGMKITVDGYDKYQNSWSIEAILDESPEGYEITDCHGPYKGDPDEIVRYVIDNI